LTTKKKRSSKICYGKNYVYLAPGADTPSYATVPIGDTCRTTLIARCAHNQLHVGGFRLSVDILPLLRNCLEGCASSL